MLRCLFLEPNRVDLFLRREGVDVCVPGQYRVLSANGSARPKHRDAERDCRNGKMKADADHPGGRC
jgi:hypothetical protein